MRYYLIVLVCFLKFETFSQPAPIQGKILTFAMQNFKKKIDRGECWDLASAALTDANADWSAPFDFGSKVDWKKEPLKPADILQFTKVKLQLPNGTMSFPQHTAIVYRAKEKSVTLIHQNFNNKRYVDTLTIDLNAIKSGKIEAYRPKGKTN